MEPTASKRRGRPKYSETQPPLGKNFLYSCRKCSQDIGQGDNRWEKLSNSYATPISSEFGPQYGKLSISNEVQKAATGSDLEGCLVQAVRCDDCDANLGLICAEAPPTKQHYRDKLAFKLAKLGIVHLLDREECEPEIIEPQDSKFSPSQLQVQVLSTTIPQRPTGVTAPKKLANKSGKAEASTALPGDIQEQLDSQEKDIDRIMNLMENFRQDVGQIRGILFALQTEVRARPTPADPEVFAPLSVSTEEFERLEGTVNSVAEKASEVDVLKMELEVMRKKIQRLERMGAPGPKTLARASSVFTQPAHDFANAYRATLNTSSNSSQSAREPNKGQLRSSERTTSVKDGFNAPIPSIEPLKNGLNSPNSFKVTTNSFKATINGFKAHDNTFEVPSNIPGAPKPTLQRKDQAAFSGDQSGQNTSSAPPVLPVPASRYTSIQPKLTTTPHIQTITTHEGSRQTSVAASVTTNKRKRQTPAPPTGYVDWSSIDDDGSVLPSLEEQHLPNEASKGNGKANSQNSTKRARQENAHPNGGRPGAEEARAAVKRRKAEIAKRDLEAQRLIEADELMD